MKLSLFVLVAAILLSPQGSEDEVDGGSKVEPRLHAIADLEPQQDGTDVTVKFTVAGTFGISQRHVPGQAPSFGIETEREHAKKSLDVWVEGELANVFDRLQMRFLQTNQLKKGTTIVATGKLRIHEDTRNGELYTLHIKEWKEFRIMSRSKPKQK